MQKRDGGEPSLLGQFSAITITLSSGENATISDFFGFVCTPYALPALFASEVIRYPSVVSPRLRAASTTV
jgi:hypothetical protein